MKNIVLILSRECLCFWPWHGNEHRNFICKDKGTSCSNKVDSWFAINLLWYRYQTIKNSW